MVTYLRKTEVATRYGVTPVTVWRWTKTDPEFPKPLRTHTGLPLWSVADLEKWEEARRAASAVGGGR